MIYLKSNIRKKFVFLAVLILSEKSFANSSCNTSEIENLINVLTPKCDISKVESYPGAKTTKTLRLSGKCATSWPARLENGESIILPSGSRVVELASNSETHSSILFHQNGKVLKAEIAKESFMGKKDCTETESINPDVFIEEAKFHLALAKEMNKSPLYPVPGDRSYIAQTELKKIEDKLNRLISEGKITKSSLARLNDSWSSEVKSIREKNKPEAVSSMLKLLKSSFSPVDSKTGEHLYEKSLFVPLSKEWFYSDPELKKFFISTWGDFSGSFQGGTGGEVWTKGRDHQDNTEFDSLKDLLAKTKKFIQAGKNEKLKATAEFKWLTELPDLNASTYNQIITIHQESYSENSCSGCFVSYIPIDQSIGGVYSDKFLSILLHEAGQGNNDFFKDTHVDHELMESLRHCLIKNGASNIAQDPYTIQALFGYSSQLSSVYIKLLLDRIEIPQELSPLNN